jgi:hypothetical protein
MSTHRYDRQALAVDYGRGGVGLLLTGGLLALSPSLPLTIVFAGLTALFAVFTLRTARRHRARLELDSEGITLHPTSSGPLPWHDIDVVRLRYYSTRRSRDKGWMTLRLGAGRRRIEVDSSLEGFDDVVARVAQLVRARDIPIDPATRANFQASGQLLDLELTPRDVPLPFGRQRAASRGDPSPRNGTS